jgi:hypothetical protein
MTNYLIQPSDYDEGPIVYPLPIERDKNNRQLWVINGASIWAEDFQQALEIAALINASLE